MILNKSKEPTLNHRFFAGFFTNPIGSLNLSHPPTQFLVIIIIIILKLNIF